MKHGGLWALGLVLVAALALQVLSFRDVKEGDRSGQAAPVGLTTRVPKDLPGWASRDEPLGPNEVTKQAVEKILNFDDVVNRVYERGGVRVGVYVAYWAPGRMPVQKVASHTPDRCWTENGWRCLEMRSAESVAEAGIVLNAAQWRIFEPPGAAGQKEYVLFWHLVGSQLYEYGDRLNATPAPLLWWRDTLKYAFSGSASQYFIRVTSNRDFRELSGDPAWQHLVVSLAELGLKRPGAVAR